MKANSTKWEEKLQVLVEEAKQRLATQKVPSRGYFFDGGYVAGLDEALKVGRAGLDVALEHVEKLITDFLSGAMTERSSPVMYERGRLAALRRAKELSKELPTDDQNHER